MLFLTQSFKICIIFFTAILCTIPAYSASKGQNQANITTSIDFNEETHLVFMREEEKLARDVYLTLGAMHPDAIPFQNIDDAEEQHTAMVKEKLVKHYIADPSTTDEIGVFTGEDYGKYFEGKYNDLVKWGEKSELDALYVGAFIEELDMLDIVECPEVIRKTYGLGKSECGLNYTDSSELQNMLGALLEGSKNHLRSYVGNIEAITGKCSYEAQILSQIDVDTILGRVDECGFDYKEQ